MTKEHRRLDIRHGDGLAGLQALSEVALVLADLPSGKTQAECDTPLDLRDLWAAMLQALNKSGVALLFASDFQFGAEVIRTAPPRWFRYEIVWHKGRASGFLNAKRRPLKAHEFILVFSPSSGSTYNAVKTQGHRPMHHMVQHSAGANFGAIEPGTASQAGTTERYPRSVISSPCVATNAAIRIHPQQKPIPLLRQLVRAYSNPGDLIVDPCAGSGASGAAALLEGRRFVGFERAAKYAEQAPQHWKANWPK